MGAKRSSAADEFSFGRMVAYALAAGALVLVIAVPIILVLARDHPMIALIIACVAVIAMIAVIGTVSRRMLAGVQREIDERRRALDTDD